MNKKIIACLSFFVFSFSICFASELKFEDVQNHWAKEYIYAMVDDDCISGYEDGCFYPDKEVSIAEFLKMLLTESDIKLVKIGNKWPDWYMVTALSKGYINQNDIENPNNILTRNKACEILGSYIDLTDVSKGKDSFSDLKSIKENETILKLVKLGVINGYKDGTFKPDEKVTRAQACKLIINSYKAKEQQIINRKYEPNAQNTNIGEYKSGYVMKHRYEIQNKRVLIKDENRYGNTNGITMNQEYIDDQKVINLINVLVDDDSYTEVIFVPDKYIINALNVCYGKKEEFVNNGIYYFQIRFYENSFYDVAKATDSERFSHNAFARIELNKMWDKTSEFNSEFKSSEKSLAKLEKTIEVITEKKFKSDIISYVKEKIIEASNLPDDEFKAKIQESKSFGKYQIDVLCLKGTKIDLYISKI